MPSGQGGSDVPWATRAAFPVLGVRCSACGVRTPTSTAEEGTERFYCGLLQDSESSANAEIERVVSRWSRYQVIAIDEVGYVPLAQIGAELQFQVIAERAEKAAIILTTNMPFSEWTQAISTSRLSKALLDRVTDRARTIETGTTPQALQRSSRTGTGALNCATRPSRIVRDPPHILSCTPSGHVPGASRSPTLSAAQPSGGLPPHPSPVSGPV